VTRRLKKAHVYVVAAGASPVEPRAHLWCKHCDERVVQSFPVRVATYVAMAREFEQEHAECPAPAAP
jgi:hypothetical protein